MGTRLEASIEDMGTRLEASIENMGLRLEASIEKVTQKVGSRLERVILSERRQRLIDQLLHRKIELRHVTWRVGDRYPLLLPGVPSCRFSVVDCDTLFAGLHLPEADAVRCCIAWQTFIDRLDGKEMMWKGASEKRLHEFAPEDAPVKCASVHTLLALIGEAIYSAHHSDSMLAAFHGVPFQGFNRKLKPDFAFTAATMDIPKASNILFLMEAARVSRERDDEEEGTSHHVCRNNNNSELAFMADAVAQCVHDLVHILEFRCTCHTALAAATTGCSIVFVRVTRSDGSGEPAMPYVVQHTPPLPLSLDASTLTHTYSDYTIPSMNDAGMDHQVDDATRGGDASCDSDATSAVSPVCTTAATISAVPAGFTLLSRILNAKAQLLVTVYPTGP